MREKILDTAESLVQKRGFDSVTFQEIADKVGLRKPSLFHHVRNKEELATLLIDRCSSKYGPQYGEVIGRSVSAPRKLKEIARIFEDGLQKGRPCLLAAIGNSRQSLSTTIRKQLEATAKEAVARFTLVFAQGRKDGTLSFKGKPEHAAMSFLGMLQGLQTLCQVKNDHAAFSRAATTYIDSLTVK